MESLNGNYNEREETLQSTKGQVNSLVKENKGLKTMVKSLEEQVLDSKKEVENKRLNDIKARHDELEQYTTRNGHLPRFGRIRTEWGRRLTCYQATIEWQNLPLSIRQPMPKNIFKRHLNEYFLDRTFNN